MPPLQIALVDAFLALVPTAPCRQVDALAAACTRDLDRFRARPSDAESARWAAARLSAQQRDLLGLWGYPYVLEEFRWHMTLTDRADPPTAAALLRYLKPIYAAAQGTETVVVDGISLVHQSAPGRRFEFVQRFPLHPSG